MDEEKRSNQNYEIIESCTIGSTELVIGHNPNAPNPYVCWYCKGGSNYFWGYYTNELDAARQKLNERYQSECRMPYNQPAQKQKSVFLRIHTETVLSTIVALYRTFGKMPCKRTHIIAVMQKPFILP